jgi:hypothetical protein
LEPFNELLNYAQLTTVVLVWSSKLSIGGVTTEEEISCLICSGWCIWKWREPYRWDGWEIVKPAVDPEHYEIASRTIMFMGFMTLVFWHILIRGLGFWEQFFERDDLV